MMNSSIHIKQIGNYPMNYEPTYSAVVRGHKRSFRELLEEASHNHVKIEVSRLFKQCIEHGEKTGEKKMILSRDGPLCDEVIKELENGELTVTNNSGYVGSYQYLISWEPKSEEADEETKPVADKKTKKN